MALLPILTYPDPRLYTVARPVVQFDKALAQLVADLFETMYEAQGIGLAATQVDVHQQVVVIDLGQEGFKPLTLINPRLVAQSTESTSGEEGCLSVPGVRDQVARANALDVEAQDTTGQLFRLHAEGLLAVCIQHEMDHLKGRVFVQYLSDLKQMRLRTRLHKQAKQQARDLCQARRV